MLIEKFPSESENPENHGLLFIGEVSKTLTSRGLILERINLVEGRLLD
jgi:hypothetical protein